MKNFKKIFMIIFFLCLFVLQNTKVFASEVKIVDSFTNKITLSTSTYYNKDNFDFFQKRDQDSVQYFCLSGNGVSVNTSENGCNRLEDEDTDKYGYLGNGARVGLAAMMLNFDKVLEDNKDIRDHSHDYWYIQVAVDKYVQDVLGKTLTIKSGQSLPNDKIANEIVDIGEKVRTLYNNFNSYVTITLDLEKLELNKTINKDGYYYTNYVDISSAASNKSLKYLGEPVITCADNLPGVGCGLNAAKNKIRLSINPNNLASLFGKTVTITLTYKYQFYTTRTYNCGTYVGPNTGETFNYQSVTPLLVKNLEQKSKSVQKTFTIPQGSATVNIGKTDKDRKYISGAVLKITGPSYSNQITTGTSTTALTLTKPGTYTITEISAPDGYSLNTNPVQFTVSADTILNRGDVGIYNITNELIHAKFKKVDAVTKKVVPGATLQILDENKNEIKDSEGKVMYVFKTLDTEYTIGGLKKGIYYLKEVSAPEGYKLNENLLKFSIDEYGKSYIYDNNNNKNEVDTIIFENYPKIKVNFSKQDATTGKELPGATLELLDGNKKAILDSDGKKKYEWVSTDKTHIIEDLEPGEYCLKETIAPKGYTKTEELVCFTLSYDKLENEVVMKNSPVAEVPDTAKSASLPMIIISIILVISGVGIIGYILYNNKKHLNN